MKTDKQVGDFNEEQDVDDLEAGEVETNVSNVRDARYLVYWTTSTSTSTTYTATSTLATLECTPASFTISVCG